MAKKSNGEGSIYRMPNGKWRAVVSLGFDSKGKRLRKYRTFEKKADAVAELRNMAQGASIGIHEASGTSVSEALRFWMSSVVSIGASDNTRHSYQRVIDSHIVPRIGAVRLGKFSPSHVQAMIADMQKSGIGDRSRQLAYVVLSNCMESLVGLGQLAANPCKRVARPKYARKSINPFTAEEARRILESTRGTRMHALYYLALSCGMRQGELLGLQWDRIDLKGGTILIDQQAVESASAKVSLSKPKTQSSVRQIAISEDVVSSLVEHKSIMLREGLASCPIVFPASSCRYQTKSNFINRTWNILLKKLGLDRRGFHTLRHTYATLALGAGVPVHIVSRVLGHSSASVTWNVYAHMLHQDQDDAKNAMKTILSGCSVAARVTRQSS